MTEILEALNTKQAVLLCMAAMVAVNALFVAGCVGLFNHSQAKKIILVKAEFTAQLKQVREDIIKRVNALIAAIEP
jgi:hypothetical protein